MRRCHAVPQKRSNISFNATARQRAFHHHLLRSGRMLPARGALIRALEPPERDDVRTREFRIVAEWRSNNSFNATRGSVAFIIPPRGVDWMLLARAR
jgi:hypothetical protein